MNCQIKEVGGAYIIEETATNHILSVCFDEKEAKNKKKFFNLGGAFDGFTPAFIVDKPLSNINKSSKNM